MEKKIFSVLIPAYNAESTILRTLSSLLGSVEHIKEVIIGDDRSEDKTAEIAMSLSSHLPIKIVKVAEDAKHGPSAARNAALNAATGEWVLFIDSDDYLEFGCLKSIWTEINHFNALQNQPVIYFPFVQVDESITFAGDPIVSNSWLHGKLYKKDFLDKNNIRFNEKYFSHEDVDFNHQVDLALRKQFGLSIEVPYNQTLNFYRWVKSDGTITRRKYLYEDGEGEYLSFGLPDLMEIFEKYYFSNLDFAESQLAQAKDENEKKIIENWINNHKEKLKVQFLVYYFYIQSLPYSCSSSTRIKKCLDGLKSLYKIALKDNNLTKQDFLTWIFNNPQVYTSARAQAASGTGDIVETTSIFNVIDSFDK